MSPKQSLTDKLRLETLATKETPIQPTHGRIGESGAICKFNIDFARGRHLVHLDTLDSTVFGLDLALDVFG
jgi:hypothetical protein